jgi:hypothetical protein
MHTEVVPTLNRVGYNNDDCIANACQQGNKTSNVQSSHTLMHDSPLTTHH